MKTWEKKKKKNVAFMQMCKSIFLNVTPWFHTRKIRISPLGEEWAW